MLKGLKKKKNRKYFSPLKEKQKKGNKKLKCVENGK